VERIRIHAKFHAGHRQTGHEGVCRFVHGHTWRGTVIVETEEFPRDAMDMSLDFGDLKKIMRDFDHRMIVTASDPDFADPAKFEPEGVVVIEGKGPSVENVARHVWGRVVDRIREKYPNEKKRYRIEVEIQETENNFFSVIDEVTV
jgi:6-pyruvoyltetrahydropterin/6-carboxytetrahydropterin synthase